MKLVIVESPSKAKTIEKYLGAGFHVTSSVGHIRDLPKSNKKALDIEGGFIPHYEISPRKTKVVAELKHDAKKADEVILATDLDREGEAIAWHLKEVLGLKNPKRITFNEITKDAVLEAMKHPRSIDENLTHAQEARRVLDRLFGYDLSALIWKKVRYGLSAGRVQSPALRIIMEREREIRAFNPETYYVLSALLSHNKKAEFSVVCGEEPFDKDRADYIEKEGNKGSWYVKNIKESEVKRNPRAPFTTSTLQQTASTLLGFAPSRTMRTAQKLYEKGLITYMRTDSTMISSQAIAQIKEHVTEQYGSQYLELRTYAKKSKSAQEAHEAIRPTTIAKIAGGATEDEKKLYKLIWRRTVTSQMTSATLLRKKLITSIKDNEDFPEFSTNGVAVLFDGWMKADPYSLTEDVQIPKLTKGDELDFISLETETKETQPPSRFSEAGLIKELEKRGIGRPSTYASIIKTIEDRGYVEKEGRTLFPTDTGDVVSSFLEQHFSEYISDDFTSQMEDNLDLIAEGKGKYKKTLEDFYGPFVKAVASKEKIEKLTNIGPAPNGEKCPDCDGDMVLKLSKIETFLSCAKFPDCTGARKKDGSILEGPKEIGQMCPDCGEKEEGKLVQREGRFGMFISCNRYPKCKFIKEDEEEVAKKKTGVLCGKCKDGEMMERSGRFGIFFSCTNYPDCKHAIKAKPTGTQCSLCESLMMEGTKTIPERCSVKTCPMHNPHKLEDKKK
ncbi:MAG: DNA topoisomerase-1 [Flavobacteriaceae bacterium]|jgi:DNA topoisomerase-1